MRALVILAALFLGFAAYAQPARDANPRGEQNTQGANTANTDANAMDPATKARVRVEGAAGGTGARVPPEASGGATVGDGDQHRHSPPKPPDSQQGESRSEKQGGNR
jgi:hypothetical protein